MSFNNEYRDSLVLIRHFTVPLKVAIIDFFFEVESQQTVLRVCLIHKTILPKKIDNKQTTLKKINYNKYYSLC